MRLTGEQDVLNIIGQSVRVGSSSTVNDVLPIATTKIEKHIGTSLARAHRIDYFGCVRNIGGLGYTAKALLNLTQGYIDEAETFAVYYSLDGTAITDVAGDNAELIDPEYYVLDATKGRLTLFGTYAIPADPFRVIAVEYTAGFDVDAHGIAQKVPDELAQAAAMVAANSMRNLSPTQNKQVQWLNTMSTFRREVTAILSPLIRQNLAGDDPQLSTVVP